MRWLCRCTKPLSFEIDNLSQGDTGTHTSSLDDEPVFSKDETSISLSLPLEGTQIN